ncbi:ATP synthase F0 subunit B [Desulfovibrio inopinatus]|uniref:ATP synthase F0 subunit B n=1 Tax=Desulfovibrio inopinatus TaxID=102109 RepID=UPI00040B34A2|nr:ATP synthase F0 subunit B [Desulfovibrio inopinatus]
MIDLDSTFFIQLVNFVVILIALNVVLIRPIRSVLEKRREYMASQADAIQAFTDTADSKLKNYEETLATARKGATDIRNALRDEGAAVEKDIMEKAGAEVSAKLAEARSEIGAQAAKAMDDLKVKVDVMAGKAVEKVLGQAG